MNIIIQYKSHIHNSSLYLLLHSEKKSRIIIHITVNLNIFSTQREKKKAYTKRKEKNSYIRWLHPNAGKVVEFGVGFWVENNQKKPWRSGVDNIRVFQVQEGGIVGTPWRLSSTITPSRDGGLSPSGSGCHGFDNTSPITASMLSFDCHTITPQGKNVTLETN